MKELIPMNENGVFADMKDVVRVDSRFVAQAFEKQHKNVLRDIENLIMPAHSNLPKFGEINQLKSEPIDNPASGMSKEFAEANFTKISYIDERGRKQKAYAMTRNGFVILVMGYTGAKAMKFKEFYIHRFDDMENQLKTLVSARTQFPKLTEQIHLLNPEAKPYVYSNECDMLNRIVLGMTAKQFRERNGLEKGESIRPLLRDDQIAMLDYLQTLDIGLMLGMPDYQQRKRQLEWSAIKAAGKFGTTKESVYTLTEPTELEDAV